MKTLAVVINPHAGRARDLPPGDLQEAIRRAVSWAEISFFDASEDVTGAARAACDSGADAVVIAGGDGTAAAVLDQARSSGCDAIMIPLPLGTANMLPRRLYGDRDFKTVLAQLQTYETVTLHAGEAAGRTFFVALMAGSPVRFGQAREALRPGGEGRRFVEAARRLRQGLASLSGSRLRLTLEGSRRKLSRSGAVIIAPGGFAALRGDEALPGPAVLDHLVVRPADPADLAMKTASFMTGTPDPACAAIASRGPSTLSGPKHIHLMLDGEVVNVKGPVEVRLIEHAARFAAPGREGGA